MLAITLACLMGVSLYILVDYKMFAQPWRMLTVALIALIFGQTIVSSIDSLDATLRDSGRPISSLDTLRSGFLLLNTVISALSGALIGAAVSNKVALLHKREFNRINEAIAEIRNDLEIAKSMRDSGDGSGTEVAKLVTDLVALERERSALE